MDTHIFEETKVEEQKEIFELNKENLPIFKRALHHAKKWIKQEKVRVKNLKKEHTEDVAIWRPRLQEYERNFKKVQAELNEINIVLEALLAKAYSILVGQGRINEKSSNSDDEQEMEGQEFKASAYKRESIDKATINLIFQLIS